MFLLIDFVERRWDWMLKNINIQFFAQFQKHGKVAVFRENDLKIWNAIVSMFYLKPGFHPMKILFVAWKLQRVDVEK